MKKKTSWFPVAITTAVIVTAIAITSITRLKISEISFWGDVCNAPMDTKCISFSIDHEKQEVNVRINRDYMDYRVITDDL